MWWTAAEFRQRFNIADNAFSAQIAAANSSAVINIRDVVSSEIYDEAIAANLETTDTNYLRQQKVIHAQGYLAWYFLLRDSGNLLTKEGVLKQAQASSSAGTDKVHVNQWLTPSEIEKMKDDALNEAQRYLGDYGILFPPEEPHEIIVRKSKITGITVTW